jgi:bacterioferritin (cytochrome b1)
MAKLSDEFMRLLYSDLRNERKHMLFYLTNSGSIKGIDAIEYIEMFEDEAKEEMNHVKEFQNMIVGIGGDLNCAEAHGHEKFEIFTSPNESLKYALTMEEEVVDNYVNRIESLDNLHDRVIKKWLEVFYEKQIEKSQADVDKYKRLLNY